MNPCEKAFFGMLFTGLGVAVAEFVILVPTCRTLSWLFPLLVLTVTVPTAISGAYLVWRKS